MVVVHVYPYLTQIREELVLADNDTMAAKAILICRPNSHQFQDRTLTLDQPVKVGRSVARAKPTPTNAIFDCKVLSRHHALLWYQNGKFYLQDTKSSNGTFVNNNRLSVDNDNHEVSSGDIVQFGVDVVENNRKVTHGCIIATLKLYLPDGKEAKASPSITEGDSHGVVPLDDLYKLNQILQDANQREQCLESKLVALQNVVEETKRSAEESWQAYVGEERLLSRLSALETQLQQARNNWAEDKLKEEIAKLQEDNERYQEAAKEALEKVHAEKQQAVVTALEEGRAKISAQQDALLAREQLEQTQLELQELAQKLSEIQTKADEEKHEHEKQVRELEQHMEEEGAKIIELEAKIYELSLEVAKKHNYGDHIERPELILENDIKLKEELLENEILSELNKSISNGFVQNHINLTVAPVDDKCETEKSEDLECESTTKNDLEKCDPHTKEDGRRVSFNLPEDSETSQLESQNSPNNSPDAHTQPETTADDHFSSDHVDSKTLKYQYQSAQREKIELRRKIEILEKNSETNKAKISELSKALHDEKELNGQRLVICDGLKEELLASHKKWEQIGEENRKLIAKKDELLQEIERMKNDMKMQQEKRPTKDPKVSDLNFSETAQNSSILSTEQLTNIEEELVLFKEKYAQICEEKVKLSRDLLKLQVQYDMLSDSMYNKYFWYVGPLVIVILYLLIREWIS
ncbi:sarcolemmal membrane-associated protein [Euwallacea similis]|uniref:sarcolemmal membrane-associated protein n=1 Tax=Euwallacea similis TaxID=1736056 RepID=UPI00344FACA7